MLVINDRFSFVGTFICQYVLVAIVWKLVLSLLQVQSSFAYVEIIIQAIFSLYTTTLMYVLFLTEGNKE